MVFFFPAVVVGLSCCVSEVVVRGYTLQVPKVLVGFSVGLLVPVFLVCVGTPGLLLGCVSRVKLRACGQRLIEECVDIVLEFGVPRTVSFHIRDGVVFLVQLLFLLSLQSAVSPTVPGRRGMWKLIGTIDDRVVQRTSRRTR